MNGLTVYNGSDTQFTTKYPALLVDRTNSYGYKNYEITFASNPPLPPDPSTSIPGDSTTIIDDILTIYHGLGYIPAFHTVTIGYGLGNSVGVDMWNEDALLSITNYELPDNSVYNRLLFRINTQSLYIKLARQSRTGNLGPPYTIYRPPSLAGAQLNINVQIFAMGLNDIASNVL